MQVVSLRGVWITQVAINIRKVGGMFIPLLRELSEVRGVTKLRVTVQGISLGKAIEGPWPIDPHTAFI